MVRRKRRSFSEAEKAAAVEYVGSSGKSVYRAAQDLDLTETARRRWVDQSKVDRGEGPLRAAAS